MPSLYLQTLQRYTGSRENSPCQHVPGLLLPGKGTDARSPQGGLCIQLWAFVLVSQVFPLNEAQGRGKSQPYIFPVVNVMPGKKSHFHSALADLGLGFISTPLNY